MNTSHIRLAFSGPDFLRRLPWILLASLVLSQCSTPAYRGRYEAPYISPRRSGAVTTPDATWLSDTTTSIPFRLDDNKIVVAARVNGEGPFLFQLDTGAEIAVFQPRLARNLGLPFRDARGQITTPAGESSGVYAFATVDHIDMGPARFSNVEALVHKLPIKYSGILNFGLFHNTVWSIDGPNQRLVLSAVDSVPPPGSRATPYSISHGVPVIPLTVAGQSVPAIIDSGFNQYFSFPDNLTSRLPLARPPVSFAQIQTLDSKFTAQIARLNAALHVGGWTVDRPVILLSRGSPLMGMGALKHFPVTFYPHHRVVRFDRPTSHPIRTPSVWGYAFRVSEPDTQGARHVVEVVQGSRAEAAGLRVGDRILKGNRVRSGRQGPYYLKVSRPDGSAVREIIAPFETLVP